jgi:hypothetical protein
MDRRKSLKILAGTVATTAFLEACKTGDEKKPDAPGFDAKTYSLDRSKEELEREKKIAADTFFDPHEMATIAILCDIIIPKDEISGSATDAQVPAFIEFMAKDVPSNQLPLRGGLRWLDMQCFKRFNKSFVDCNDKERIEMVDEIAYPNKAKPGMKAGVQFFSTMRNLVASGFYSSRIGMEDIGYTGNVAHQWNGVPADVLKQYGLAYSEKELKECVSFDK